MSAEGASVDRRQRREGSLNRLESLFIGHSLSPAQRRISRYVVENASEVAYLSSNELAEAVGVSQASVSRLASSVGLGGYSQLQKHIRDALHTSQATQDPHLNKFQMAIQTEIDNLAALRDALPHEDDLRTLAERLINSPCLVVIGQRMTAQLAGYFAHNASKILPDVRTLTAHGSLAIDILMQARQCGGNQVVLFLSPRLPAELIANLRLAKHLGFDIHAITDSDLSPRVAAYCDTVLLAPAGKSLVFDTHAAHMVVGNILLEAITDAAPETTQKRLEQYEEVLQAHNVFISE